LFFFDEMPKMSAKFLHLGNEGLGNAIQVLFHGRQMQPTRPSFVWASRAISVIVLGLAYWLSQPLPQKQICKFKTEVFAIFLLLSCCLSPVSWLNAYVLSIPLLAIVGIRVWHCQSTSLDFVLFTLLVLSLSIAAVTGLRMLTPIAGIALGLARLYGLRKEHIDADLGHAALSHPR
jgi:hypothetical protein